MNFIGNLNALVQENIDLLNQEIDQLRGQTFRTGNCLCNLRAAGLPCLFLLLLFRLCCDCGIGVFYFEDGCVTGCFLGLVGFHINFAHDILLKQGLLAILQSLDLCLIFRAFTGNLIQTDTPVRTNGKNSSYPESDSHRDCESDPAGDEFPVCGW